MRVTLDVGDLITSELSLGKGTGAVAPGDDLLAKGLVDSHGVMELVGFLEDRYGISLRDEDLVPENFQSLARIEGFVARRKG